MDRYKIKSCLLQYVIILYALFLSKINTSTLFLQLTPKKAPFFTCGNIEIFTSVILTCITLSIFLTRKIKEVPTKLFVFFC